MHWPNNYCPPSQHVIRARDILDYIISKAIGDQPPNAAQVIMRASNCKANLCAKPWSGGDPDDPKHCVHVERAKFFADAGDWFTVADELEHP